MLSQYVPEDCYISDAEYIREVILDDRIIQRGRLTQLDGRYYSYKTLTGDERKALAATTITNEIDFESLPKSHKYHRSHDGSEHDTDDWPLINWYSRKRGILLHHLILRDGSRAGRRRAEKLLSNIPDDYTAEDVQAAVSKWQHAPRVPHPDEDAAFDDCHRALRVYMQFEAEDAASYWQAISGDIDSKRIDDEALILGETDDGHAYGGQIDRVTAVKDAPIQPAVYVLDIKVSEDWHPRHLVQAEAYRRTLTDDIPDIQAAVIRLGVNEGDYQIISTHDEEWDSDELWDIFCRRAKSLYDDSLHAVALRNSGR